MTTSRRAWIRLATAAVLTGPGCGLGVRLKADDGPNSSLFSGRLKAIPVSSRQPGAAPASPTTTSWYEVPLPPPKEVRVHDIITIRVDLAVGMTAGAEGHGGR